MSQENIRVVISAFQAALAGDMEAASRLLTSDHVFFSPYPAHLPFGGEAQGLEKTLAMMKSLGAYFDRVSLKPGDVIAQGDTVVFSFEEKAVAKGTGKSFVTHSVLLAKVRDGKVSSSRLYADTYAATESLRTDNGPGPR